MAEGGSSQEEAPTWYRWLQLSKDWQEFSRPAGGYKPQVGDLSYGLLCALLLLLLRTSLEFGLLRPLGRRLGMSAKKLSLSKSFKAKAAVLEPHFSACRRPDAERLRQLSQLVGFSENSIDNWFRQRRNRDKPSPLVRFSECCWYTVYYSVLFVAGVIIQWRRPYFLVKDELFQDWPHQLMPTEVFWYYMVQLGFYCSSLVTLAFDVRRKDFLEMSLHHVVTVALILMSWALNFTRFGALTLVLHDAIDPLLNVGKLGQYVACPLLSDSAFAALVVVWIATRLVALPVLVVYPVYADSLRVVKVQPCLPYYAFVGCFLVLQLLHFVWTYYLFRALYIVVWQGKKAGDTRSDSEMSDEAEEEGEKKRS